MSDLPALPHLIIRASAGTGKTYQLTHRYMAIVKQGAPPQAILATTFTRKAAYEIMERVIRLAAESALKNPNQRIHLKQLTTHLHKLMIETLDSLFQKMGRCFALELQLPANAQILDDTDFAMQQLQTQAMDQVLANNPPRVLLDLMRRLYHSDASARVFSVLQNIITDLYHIYKLAPNESQWANYNTDGLLSDEHLKQIIDVHKTLEDQLPRKKNGDITVLALKTWNLDQQLIAQDQWQIFLTKGIAKKVSEGASNFGTAQLSESLLRVYKILIMHAKAWLLQRERELNLARFELAKQYAQAFDELREQMRILTHSDVPQRLEKVFSDPDDDFLMDLAYRMDQKIDHMMLDEFQDTSMQQWHILRPQAQEICAHVDKFASRQFLCVGDVKQAIYGWRGGCAEIFGHIDKDLNLPPQATVRMNQSYRSSQVILDVINPIFNGIDHNDGFAKDQLLLWASQWKTEFDNHTAANDLPGYVHFQALSGSEFIPDENDLDELSNAQTIEVCNKIADLHNQAPDRSIGVLVWTNDQVLQLLTRLRWIGIDVASEGGVSLHDDPSVSCILAAMRMADRPDDSSAAFEVLNSPLGKYLGMTRYHHEHIRPIAWKIRQQLLSIGYPRLIGHWANLLSEHSDARGSERLALLVQLAVIYEPNATLKPSDFVLYVQGKQVPLSQQSPVQVMTIHKSKGLEFDAVVLPSLKRKLGALYQQTTYVTRPSPIDPIAYVYASGFKELHNLCPELQEAHQQESERRFRDDLCGFYVALTRAKYALYLFAEPVRLKKNSSQLTTFGYTDSSIAAILRQTLIAPEDIGPDEGEILYTQGDPHWFDKLPDSEITVKDSEQAARPSQPCSIKIKSQTGKRSLPRISPSQMEGGGNIRVSDLLALTKSTGQTRGTVIHKLFESIKWLDNQLVLPTRDELIALLNSNSLKYETEYLDAFIKMLKMPAVIDALRQPADWDEEHCELWREKNFAVLMDGRLVQGQIDRAHVWKDRVLILDYKTDTPPPPPEAPEAPEAPPPEVSPRVLDVFESKVSGYNLLVDHYRPQIQAYRKAVAAMRKLPLEKVATKLVFVRDGVVCDVN